MKLKASIVSSIAVLASFGMAANVRAQEVFKELSGQAALNQLLEQRVCQNCDMSGMDLSGYDFTETVVTYTNFQGADLRNVDWSNSDLSGAFLEGADLRNADLSNSYFYEAKLDATTLLSGAAIGGTKPNPYTLR